MKKPSYPLIRQKMSQLWSESLHQVLFASVPLTFFLVLSFIATQKNDATLFTGAGALILVSCVLLIARNREAFGNSASDWERARFNEFGRLFWEVHTIGNERLDLTFDIHASQIVQMSATMGVPNPFVENDDKEIEKFCAYVAKRHSESDITKRYKEALEKFNAFNSRYKDAKHQNRFWSPFLYRFEMILLVWGTLQSTLGASFLELLHS